MRACFERIAECACDSNHALLEAVPHRLRCDQEQLELRWLVVSGSEECCGAKLTIIIEYEQPPSIEGVLERWTKPRRPRRIAAHDQLLERGHIVEPSGAHATGTIAIRGVVG